MQAVILAGGKGTRLRSRLGDLPKPMVDIGGKPLLQWQVELLSAQGCGRILVLLGYKPEAITGYHRTGGEGGDLVEVPFLGDGRIAWAPVEDLGFGFALVLATCALWVRLGRQGRRATPGSAAPAAQHPGDGGGPRRP